MTFPEMTLDELRHRLQLKNSPLSKVCQALVLLPACSTYDDLTGVLEDLSVALQRQASTPPEPYAYQWTHDCLEAIILDVPTGLTQPGNAEQVRAKALEAYGALVPWIPHDGGLRIAAINLTKKVLATATLPQHVIPYVLVPLLNAIPDSRELVEIYNKIVKNASGHDTSSAKEVIKFAIANLHTLTDLESHHLLRLVQSGIWAATQSWANYGQPFVNAVTQILADGRLDEHLDKVLQAVQYQIKSGGIDLLEDPARNDEYEGLSRVIVKVHNAQGNNRRYRPRNRHVVPNGVLIRLTISIEGQELIQAEMQNFTFVATEKWRAGAWAVDRNGHRAVDAKGWQPARITIEAGSLRTLSLAGDVDGPFWEPEPKLYGYRIKWHHVPAGDDFDDYMNLSDAYPIKR
jgi:hypothetical protein